MASLTITSHTQVGQGITISIPSHTHRQDRVVIALAAAVAMPRVRQPEFLQGINKMLIRYVPKKGVDTIRLQLKPCSCNASPLLQLNSNS